MQPGTQQHSAVPLEVPAGTVVVTSDAVLHCSGANRSRHVRRAWMPQFSAGPLTWRADGRCVSLAVPLRGGEAGGAAPAEPQAMNTGDEPQGVPHCI